jgi:hypothetical protein
LSPKIVDWKLAEITNTIRDYRVSDKINMMIIPHTPLTSALDYYLQLNNPGEIIFPLNATFLGREYISPPVEKYREEIEKCEFVLSQEGESFSYDAQSKWITDSIVSLTTAFEGVKNKFSLIKTVNICDGKPNILIYRKNNWSVKDIKQPSGNQEPAGEGLLIRAVDFSEGNLVYNQEFGLLIDGGVSPAYVSYDITLPYDGHYEVWVKYATRDFRPVEIYFDGSLIKSRALAKFTQGWTYFESSWFKELELDADRGRHLLKLIAKTTPFPHLDSIKIIYKIK